MGGAANKTQLKVSVDSEIRESFKTACASANVSMASVLSGFMSAYANMPAPKKRVRDLSTRRGRRAELQSITSRLLLVKEAEERYRDNIPENLQGSVTFERADNLVSLLDEAVDLLGSAE